MSHFITLVNTMSIGIKKIYFPNLSTVFNYSEGANVRIVGKSIYLMGSVCYLIISGIISGEI